MATPVLRPAAAADSEAIAAIYAHYVVHSSVSFELEPPAPEEMARRRRVVIDQGLPYLAAELDGRVVGYAYASPYRPRAAYRFTVEDTLYVDPAHTRRGIGRLLLGGIIQACERGCWRQMIAVIGGSGNHASIGLHRAMGFTHVGTLRAVGWKHGAWEDTVLMQRALGPGDGTAAEGR